MKDNFKCQMQLAEQLYNDGRIELSEYVEEIQKRYVNKYDERYFIRCMEQLYKLGISFRYEYCYFSGLYRELNMCNWIPDDMRHIIINQMVDDVKEVMNTCLAMTTSIN